MRAARSAFELPVGKLTATDGLQANQKSAAKHTHIRSNDHILVDRLARNNISRQCLQRVRCQSDVRHTEKLDNVQRCTDPEVEGTSKERG